MTERLADIGARIAGVRQIGAVVNAMRGIAAARAQQARTQLGAVDDYARTIAAAIASALALIPPANEAAAAQAGRLAIVVFLAEQGFAGTFSERVLDAAGADLATADLFLIGTRGTAIAAERQVVPGWHGAMPAHSPGIPRLAETIVAAIYARIAVRAFHRLDVVFAQYEPGHATEIKRIRLLPLDTHAFPPSPNGMAPLLTLAPNVLLAALATDYLFAQLCRAALCAFAAENQVRMEAMAAAHSQIDTQLAHLRATQRQVRQEEITSEIIELAAGETASRPQGRR